MCGKKALVAKKIRERAEQEEIPLSVYCFDIAFGSMDPIPRQALIEDGYHLHIGDVTEGTRYTTDSFDRAAARFGIKNYQPDTQTNILSEIRRILTPDGIFVLVDMISPPESYEWAQIERRRKSRHTIGEENAHHHLPTLPMWFDMMEAAGLTPNREDVYETKSYVSTRKWVDSNQMGEEGMRDMNQFLLSAPEHVRRDFNIREEEGEVKIDYPVVVIAAQAA